MKLLNANKVNNTIIIIDALLISIIIFCFYFYKLGSYAIFIPDEGRYSEIAREMLASGDYITPKINGLPFLDKPPLHYWLQALAIKCFGVKEWSLRLFPLLFALWGIIITYIVSCQLINRRSGLLAAFILATSPLYFSCAHYADLNMEMSVLIATALFFYIYQTQAQTNNAKFACLIGMYVAMALAFLTKGLIGIAFPVMIIFAWLALTQQYKNFMQLKPCTGIVIFLALCLPWLYFIQQAQPNFFHHFFLDQQIDRYIHGHYNNKFPSWFYFPVILLGAFPWAFFLIYDLKIKIKHRSMNQLDLFLYLWIIIIVIFFSIPQSKLIAYVLPIFPALAILVGQRINSIWKADINAKFKRVWLVILIGIALLYCVFANGNWINFGSHFKKYLYLNATVYALLALYVCFKQKLTIANFVLLCLLANGITQASLTAGVHHLNMQSSKHLITQMKPVLKPQDQLVIFFDFFPDVPLYLDRLVYVVHLWPDNHIPIRDDWKRELVIGSLFSADHTLLIKQVQLKRAWVSNNRVFVFLSKRNLHRFSISFANFYIIAENSQHMIVSNHA